MKYRVVWVKTEWFEDVIESDSEEGAVLAWEDAGNDGELSYTEDEQGNQVIYD